LKIKFSRQILEKYSDIRFYENPPSGSRVAPCGRTDRNNESNGRFSQFYERVSNLGATRTEMAVQILRTFCFHTVSSLLLSNFHLRSQRLNV